MLFKISIILFEKLQPILVAMNFKKDWSLAHFLYYLSWFITIGVVIQFIALSLPSFFGANIVVSVPFSDAQVAIKTKSLGIQEGYYSNPQTVFSIGENMYINPFLTSDKEDFNTASIVTIMIRFLRYSILFVFFMMLTQILKTVIEKTPFHSSNPVRLYIMGISIILLYLVQILQSYTFAYYFSLFEPASQFEFSYIANTNSGIILLGLSIVLLGYVFKEGTRMYEEQKLTV